MVIEAIRDDPPRLSQIGSIPQAMIGRVHRDRDRTFSSRGLVIIAIMVTLLRHVFW
jgi:hypothetical protein